MIKEFLIDPVSETVLATIVLPNGDTAKVFCDTGGDGGDVFLDALNNYSGGVGGALYFNGREIVDAGDRPSQNHRFNYSTKQWEDPRTLEDLQALKWAEIKQARTQAEFGPFIYNGMEFDGDLDAQRRLASYISVSKSAIASGVPFQAEFILADDSVVTLTAQDFVGIEMAKVQQVAAAFAHAVQLRAQIDAATTKEEVEAVVW